jgi:CDP-paratose 2-epimerase
VREECAAQPGARSLYGLTKFASEGLIEEYRAAFGLKAAVDRCGVIAGPWQMGKVDQGVVSLWVLRHYFGKPLTYIGYGGTGKQVRDVLHVDDLCDLVDEQLSNFAAWDGWLGNVGGGLGCSMSLRELTALSQEATGKQVDIKPDLADRPADLRLFLADCHRLFERTAWRPCRNPQTIVTDIFNWVRAHEAELRPLV